MADTGWAVAQSLIPMALCKSLRMEAIGFREEDKLTLAGIGRADDYSVIKDIRRDKTRWLTRDSAAQSLCLDAMEEVRLAVNRSLLLGLFAFEAHYAVYEPGGFYKRHMDAFKGRRNRVLSSVLYLNEDWLAEDGGALAIYRDMESEGAIGKVLPEFGTLLLFLSEDIPHEVLPARRSRYSIAGWFRVNDRAKVPSLQVPVLL